MVIDDHVALVTGAGSGLGQVLAEGLAAAGARIVVADVDLSAAERVAAHCSARGRKAIAVEVDVRDDDQLGDLVATAAGFGPLRLLVNNAGGWTPGPDQYPAASVAAWSATLDLNLRAPMLLTQLCLEPMRRAGGGVVVNIASSAGVGSTAYGSPEYGATKAALIRLTTSLADLPRTWRVRVACVVPDWIGLDRAVAEVAAMPPEQRAVTPPLIPPADVLAVVLDLVADDTMSGQVVELQGGRPPSYWASTRS